MSGSIINLIVSLLSGAAGGNIVGSLLKQFDLGPIGNSIAGIVGGGIGGQLVSLMVGGGAPDASGLDIGSIVSQVVSGGVGGGLLMVIVGLIKQMMGAK